MRHNGTRRRRATATADIHREQIDCPPPPSWLYGYSREFETKYTSTDPQKLFCLIYALIRFLGSCCFLDVVVGINAFLVHKVYVATELHEFGAVCQMTFRNLTESSNYGSVFRSRILAIVPKKHGTRRVVHRV